MKVIAKCFDCKEPHDVTKISFGQAVECDKCGGTVITKSGFASICVENNYGVRIGDKTK